MKRDFYYYEKRNPLRWVIIALVAAAVLGGGYWYYVNYFSTAGLQNDISSSMAEQKRLTILFASGDTALRVGDTVPDQAGDIRVPVNGKLGLGVIPGDLIIRAGEGTVFSPKELDTVHLSNGTLFIETSRPFTAFLVSSNMVYSLNPGTFVISYDNKQSRIIVLHGSAAARVTAASTSPP